MTSLSSRLGLPIVVGLVLAITPSASAQTYEWSAGSGNLWSNSGNWNSTPDGFPNASSAIARFIGGTGTNVDVDGTFTLGRLTVEALSAQSYFDLSTTSGGSLTFNNGASASVIESLPGAGGSTELFLKVPVVIAGNGNLQINNATGVRLQISGNISGTGSNITINAGGQTGVVTLIGTNAYGTSGSITTVLGGTLRANEGVGLPTNSTLVLNGGVFELFDDSTTDFTFSRNLGTGVANARLIGGGTTRAGFSVFEGILNIRLNNGTAAVTWGDADFNPGVLVLGTASPTENNIVIFENALNLNGAVRTVSAEGFGFANSSYSQMTGVLSGSASAGLTKQGNGILELTAINTFGGRTTISAGVLRANSGQGLPTNSALRIDGGVLENFNSPTTFSRNIGSGAGQVELINGGFSASNGTMTIQLNGGSGPVTWGNPGFYATDGTMRLGSTNSNALVNFTNGINLGSLVRTVEVDGSGSPNALARLSGPISGTGGLTISGNGVSLLELTGTNTYTGETRIFEGTVRANHGQGLPASSPLFLDDGGILESIGAVTFSRSLGNGAGQVRLNGNSGFAASGGPMTILLNGSIATVTWGVADFLPGTGSLVLGSLSANDLVDFQNGLNLGGQVRTVTVLDNALSQTDRARISGAISTGSLTKLGDGVLELTGPNVYTGQTSVLGGVLRANDGVGLPVNSALLLDNMGVIEGIGATTFTRAVGTGTGQVEIGPGGGGFSASGGVMTVQLNGGTGTVVWNTTVPGLAGPLVLGSASSNNLVDFQNGIDLFGGTVSIYANGGQARISGVITNGGIEKYGVGSLELTRANTYDGVTQIREGRLVISNGTTGSATGTSTVNVQSGGTLTGSGQIVGANGFNALPGSRIEPGGVGGRGLSVGVSSGNSVLIDGTWALRIESPGTGGVALNSGSSTVGAVPTNHNFLVLTSGGTANSVVLQENANWEIDGTGLTFMPNQRYSYAIGFTAPGEVAAGTITDQSRFTPVGFTANDFSLTTMSDGRIILNFTPVPEPVTVFGIAAAGLGLVGLVRRRR